MGLRAAGGVGEPAGVFARLELFDRAALSVPFAEAAGHVFDVLDAVFGSDFDRESRTFTLSLIHI